MASPRQFGLLLIAGGHTHQESYARAFADDPRCRLIGLTDEPDVPPRRRELNRQLADELGIPLLDDLDEALARDDVDLVSVCAEPERRARLTIRAAQAGKHVYVDKPLCTTREEARQVCAAVEKAGVRSQTFSLVRTKLAQRAREIVESGELGELVGIHCELFFAKGKAGTADLSKPRVEKPHAAQFTFLDSKRELYCVGWYPLILISWLTGRRVEEVNGSTSNYFFREHQQNDVEDFAGLLLRMQGALEASITVGRSGWASHRGQGVHRLHLVGTNKAVSLDADRPRLEIDSDAPPWQPPQVPHPEDPMGFWASTQKEGGVRPKQDWLPISPELAGDATCFLDCLEAGRESDVPVRLGAHALKVILAGYVSAASGGWVPVE